MHKQRLLCSLKRLLKGAVAGFLAVTVPLIVAVPANWEQPELYLNGILGAVVAGVLLSLEKWARWTKDFPSSSEPHA